MLLRVTAPSYFKARHSHLLLLGLIILFAALLRFFSLSSLGFWTDELCSLSAADGWGLQLYQVPADQIAPPLPVCTRLKDARPIWQIPIAMARDERHPPLYFILLRLWEEIFGDSESGVRSLNVVFSLVAIALLYFAARDSVGSFTAITACLLMAVATPQIQLAQEARNYMPVLVFSLLAAISIQQLARGISTKWMLLLAAMLLLMMLTHYFAAGVAIGLMAYALFAYGNRTRRQLVHAIAIATVSFAVAWGPAILKQRSTLQTRMDWLNDFAPGHIHRRLVNLCCLPVRFFVEIIDAKPQTAIAVIGLLMLLALPLLFIRRRELRMWICWGVGAIGIVAIADFTRCTTQLNWVRYSLFATPAACVLLAAAVQRRRWRSVLPAIAVIAALLNLHNAYVPAWKTDLHSVVQVLSNHRGPNDALVIAGHDLVADGIVFAAFQHYMPVMPTTAVFTHPPDAPLLATVRLSPAVQILWLWPDQPFDLPGFHIQERVTFPYLAEFAKGRFVDSQPEEYRESPLRKPASMLPKWGATEIK